MMETVRAYYEYPPSHAHMPARDYGGSVTPAKAKRSWGDLLKFRSRPKDRHLSPVTDAFSPPVAQSVTTHNYMAEYRQKYGGGYGGTVGRASYQSLRVVQGVSPPPMPTHPAQIYGTRTNYAATTGTLTAASKTTMASTVRYTDWFGSVAGRRPPVRPPLPNFNPAAMNGEKTAAWDHYVTMEPVYAAPQPVPQIVPVQLYTNVCVCPDQLLNTRSRKKKKCKRCGRKVATVRHATTNGATKVRPAIPANMYQPPTQIPVNPQHSWGWQVLEERVYQHYDYELEGRPPIKVPSTATVTALSEEEEESPPPTPETVRSVRSARSNKSGRSSDSSHTITRESLEPSRPAPPPPLPALPAPPSPVTNSSAKDQQTSDDIDDKRNSILAQNTSAYQLLSSNGNGLINVSSDTDELSDHAVYNADPWDTGTEPALTDPQEGRVNVITIGSNEQGGNKMSNKIRINTISDEAIYSTSDQTSDREYRDVVSGYDSSIYSSSLNDSTFTDYEDSSGTRSTYSDNNMSPIRSGISFRNNQQHRYLPIAKLTTLNNKINSSKSRNSSSSAKKNSSTKSDQNSINAVENSRGKNSSKKSGNGPKFTTQNDHNGSRFNTQNEHNGPKFTTQNDHNGPRFTTQNDHNSIDAVENSRGNNSSKKSGNGPRLEVKKLREASELQRGGNTVRIAGQRMLVLTPGTPQPDITHSGFSSSGDENEEDSNNMNSNGNNDSLDDTSDYPASSPTTTHASDSDTLPEDEDLPLDPPNSTLYGIPSTIPVPPPLPDSRWVPRDTIYEEEEEETEDHRQIRSTANDDKDDPSASSSSTSSPSRLESRPRPPTLSELLKVKSILKKPPSVDTSSETDSDFYLPTFSEFKRKKKQVQFRASHDITVIEDAGESKGRKVPSSRSHRRDREKEKERRKNNYNLIADLHDVYSRNFSPKVQPKVQRIPHINGFSESKIYGQNPEIPESDYDYDQGFLQEGENEEADLEEERDGWNMSEQETQDQSSDINGDVSLDNNEDQNEMWGINGNTIQEEDEEVDNQRDNNGPSLHRGLYECQTSSESFTDPAQLPLTSSVPTRQAPPPPRGRALSPPRPSVPPPPPPTTKSPVVSPSQRPLPSPPALPLSPPPESPPPSPPPPPLPTSPPPPLDDSDRVTILSGISNDALSPQSPTFSSFKSSGNLSPPILIPSTLPFNLSPSTPSEQPRPKEQLREVLPPLGHIPVFSVNEETRTATIRGRGAAHSRPSFIDTFSDAGTSDKNGSSNGSSSPPQAPRRRNRNRSMSPEQSGGRGRRASFLSSLVGEEHPYEQITDHIYEELLSHSSSPSQSAAHMPPSPGKSMFDGASKYEILEYLQDARMRVAISGEDDDDDTIQGLEVNPLEGEVELDDDDDEEEDRLGVERVEDHFTSALTSRNRGHRSSNMSSNSDSSENSGLLRTDKERLMSGEVERTDSGVGSETSKPSVAVRRGQTSGLGVAAASREGTHSPLSSDLHLCDDCDSHVDTHITNSGVVYAPLVCRRCSRRRQERKEILTEIMETEVKYGQDLRVMLEQFYRPILVAGLLSREQLTGIFLNVEELVQHNRNFCLQLRDALEIAVDQGDEDLLTVNVARLFLQAAPMLHAFETYCVRQGSASLLLQSLEKEKELLGIFLKVSQMENTLLRRMNLHSFLMVPVQRVTKYPLLLARLYKSTPPTHPSREDCRRAKEKIELHLHHMNNETKDVSPTKLWRRISLSVGSGTPLKRSPYPHHYTTNLRLRKLALEVLGWGGSEATSVVREGRMLCLAPDSNNWTRRGRSIKMAAVQVLLITHGMPQMSLEDEVPEDGLVTPRNLGIKDAAILAFKDHKVSKAALIRNEPWFLSRCVVAWESEGETECFEITDLNSRDTFIFKGTDSISTDAWFRYIQFHALSVGMWKKRRRALANIMINSVRS